MKKYILTLIATCFFMCSFSQHHKFSFEYSYGFAGGSKPTTSRIGKADALSTKQADELVPYFLESSKLDFKCIYNGCQNRAMVMSLLLNKKGIKHYKIWNFDPYKVSIFNKQDALDVEDVLKLKTGKVLWDFHVAIAVVVDHPDAAMDTLVIDPSFANRPLRVSEWLELQNSPNSYYTFIDPIWYNFVTVLPNTSLSCNGNTSYINIPNCFPAVLTGDFYSYSAFNCNLIAEELATNEQITKIASNIVEKIASSDPAKAKLTSMLTDNFNSFKAILNGNSTLDPSSPFSRYLPEYKTAYAKSLAYWRQQLELL